MKKAFLLFFILLFCSTYSGASDWKILKSTHFIIHYNKADINFISSLKDSLEGYYQEITEEIGFTRYENFWIWDNRAKVFCYDAKNDYLSATKQPEWSLATAQVKDKIINTYVGAQTKETFNTIIRHELTHLIFREFIGMSSEVPLWFEEGVANFFSRDNLYIEPMMKKVLSDNRYINLDKLPKILTGLSGQDVQLFYLEAGAVIYYLIKNFGKANFVGLCRSLRDGKTLNQALFSNYPIRDVDELNKRIIKYFSNG